MPISFDTPQTATAHDVPVTGTIPAHSFNGYVRVTVNVKGSGADTRNDTFYQEVALPENTTATTVSYHSTVSLALVPRVITTTQSVTETWSFAFKQ